jgi:hypothetical protein
MREPPNPHVEPSRFKTFLLKIAAGVDIETLKQCAQRDVDSAMVFARLLIASAVYLAFTFTLVSHRLFATPDEIRPSLIFVSVCMAIFIAQIDSYIMKAQWYREGIAQLVKSGIDMSEGALARIKGVAFLVVRIGVLSVGLAQLSALFLSLIIFSGDINARVEKQWREDNASLLAAATIQVNSQINRTADAVAHQTSVTQKLSSQTDSLRAGEIASEFAVEQAQRERSQLLDRKAKAEDDLAKAELFASNELAGIRGAPGNSGQAGRGPRRRAALENLDNSRRRIQEVTNALTASDARLESLQRSRPAESEANRQRIRDQRIAFEESLKAENAKLAALKDELDEKVSRREKAIRDAVEGAPNHVRRDDGLLAQIRILGQIADENPRMAFIIILIDLVAFGFELAPVLAKVFGHVPTGYAALLAYTSYMEGVRIAERMSADLKAIDDQQQGSAENVPGEKPAEGEPNPDTASGTDAFESPNNPVPPPPVKRGRGRPRKSPPPAAPPTNANGRADQAPEGEPGKPT